VYLVSSYATSDSGTTDIEYSSPGDGVKTVVMTPESTEFESIKDVIDMPVIDLAEGGSKMGPRVSSIDESAAIPAGKGVELISIVDGERTLIVEEGEIEFEETKERELSIERRSDGISICTEARK